MIKEDITRLSELWGTTISRSTEKEVTMQCPFAPLGYGHKSNEDRNPNFNVTINDQGISVCFCFACGSGGTVKQVAYKLFKSSGDIKYKEALALVEKVDGGKYDPLYSVDKSKSKSVEIQNDKVIVRVMKMAKKGVSPILKARGISDGDVKKWDLRFDELNHRDLFPMLDYKHNLVALSGRRIHAEQTPKYLHYGESPANITKIFYGEQFIDPTVSSGILVEGPTDTIVTSRHFPNVLGQSGAHIITAARLKRLKRWFRTITLLYDSDAAGSMAMFKVGLTLFKHMVLFVAFLPKGLDPFDASVEQRNEALQKRVLWSLVNWGSQGAHGQ